MKRILSLLVSSILMVSALTGCGAKSAADTKPAAQAAAKSSESQEISSNEITVYTALENEQITEYLKTFSQKYPNIKVNIVRDSTGIITAKLLAEKNNPVADVVWGTAASSMLVLEQNQMLLPYSPKGIERVQPEFRDTKNPPAWVGIDVWETAFVVNKEELKKKNVPVPTSYEDLTKPEYKGMIVMSNPASSGTGFLTVSALLQLNGDQKGWEFLNKLHNNIAVYVHSGSKPAKMAAAGEYAIGISFGYAGISQQKKGAPVEVVFPKEGSGWDVEANALMKKAQVKKEAKLFLDWAITDEVMKEYNKNYAILSVKGNGKVPEGYSKDPVSQLIKKNDLNWAAKNRDTILDDWTKKFDAKSEPK